MFLILVFSTRINHILKKNILVFDTIIKKVKNNESEEKKNRQVSSINNRSLMIYMQKQEVDLLCIYSCVA